MKEDSMGEGTVKNRWSDKFSVSLSIIVLFLVAALSLLDVVPPQQKEAFETASNIVMLGLAIISFFWGWLFASKSSLRAFTCTFSNLAVSTIAFIMNIYVFGRVIQLEQFPTDLWGWHWSWMITAALQVLILSGLGKCLIHLFCKLCSFGKEIAALLGQIFSKIAEIIRNSEITIVCTMILGFLSNTVYLGWQIAKEGAHTTFSDADVLLVCTRIWLLCVFIGFLLYVVPSALTKARNAFKDTSDKKVLIAFGVTIVLALLACIMPALLGMLGNIIIALMLLAGLLGFAVKRAIAKDHAQPSTDQKAIKRMDVMVLLLAFIVIPLAVICLGTAVSAEGQNILMTQDKTDLTTWLNFWAVVLEVMNGFLQLFGIG